MFLTQDEVLVGKPERLTAPDAGSLITRQDHSSITFKVPSTSTEANLKATAFYEEQKIAGIEVRPDRYTGFILFRSSRPQQPVFSKGAACLAHKGVEYSKPVFVVDMGRTVPADYVAQYLRENARANYQDVTPIAGIWMEKNGRRRLRRPLKAIDTELQSGTTAEFTTHARLSEAELEREEPAGCSTRSLWLTSRRTTRS